MARAAAGIKLEHAVALDDCALIAGRSAAGEPFVAVVDVPAAAGSVALTLGEGPQRRSVTIRLDRDAAALRLAIAELGGRLAVAVDALVASPAWASLLRAAVEEGAEPPGCRGYIEFAQEVPGSGGLAVGWALSEPRARLWLVSGTRWRSLDEAVRFQRADIQQGFAPEFGALAAEAGFLCALYGAWPPGSPLSLVAAGESGLGLLGQKAWEPAPASPLHFAKCAFGFPTPPGAFCERLARHDGALLEKLIEQSAPALDRRCEEWAFGAPPAAPWASVLVPLYGRADYMEHQLLEFCDDPDFRSGGAELVYVVDDPQLRDAVRERGQVLLQLYGVPFRVLWGRRNRGFAGANNLGASRARAPHLVFLNSDAFPVAPGWARRMVQLLRERTEVAAVGARLLYPDGSLQHLGMELSRDPYFGVWLNRHPGKGLPAPAAGAPTLEVPAATAACLAVRKHDFEAVGGFDEGFLVGDFEDSDLCLKLRSRGGAIVVLTDTEIVHLERQSFGSLGSEEFRGKVVLFNAWRHARRWGARLEGMAEARL